MDLYRITKNAIRCKLCGDVVESKRLHDPVWCSCGACAADGGHHEIKRLWRVPDCYEELAEYDPVPLDELPPDC